MTQTRPQFHQSCAPPLLLSFRVAPTSHQRRQVNAHKRSDIFNGRLATGSGKRHEDLCGKVFSCALIDGHLLLPSASECLVLLCLSVDQRRRAKGGNPTFVIFHFSPARLMGADAQMRQFRKRKRRKDRRIKRQPIVACVRQKIKAAGYFQGVSNGSQHPGCISPRRPAVPLETLLVW